MISKFICWIFGHSFDNGQDYCVRCHKTFSVNLLGMKIKVNPNMPGGKIEFYNTDGRGNYNKIGEIININGVKDES